jgi:hypothetical protein
MDHTCHDYLIIMRLIINFMLIFLCSLFWNVITYFNVKEKDVYVVYTKYYSNQNPRIHSSNGSNAIQILYILQKNNIIFFLLQWDHLNSYMNHKILQIDGPRNLFMFTSNFC